MGIGILRIIGLLFSAAYTFGLVHAVMQLIKDKPNRAIRKAILLSGLVSLTSALGVVFLDSTGQMICLALLVTAIIVRWRVTEGF